MLLYCITYRKYRRDYRGYTLVIAMALGHAIFELVTTITVNMQGILPVWVIDVSHYINLTFVIFFAGEYYHYILSLVRPKYELKKVMIPSYIIIYVVEIAMLLSRIDYFQGNGTYYSAGPAVYIAIGMGFWILFVTSAIVIAYRKMLGEKKSVVLVGIVLISFILLTIQAQVPEFFISGGILTLFCFNLFLAIEDPFKAMENKAFIDYYSGLYNRNCYENDYLELKTTKVDMGFVMCDLNYLKHINDTYGHAEGDQQINLAATILQKCLGSANRIYRVGGDEFVAVFKYHNIENIEKEVALAQERCKEESKSLVVPIEIAMGFAIRSEGEELDDMVNR